MECREKENEVVLKLKIYERNNTTEVGYRKGEKYRNEKKENDKTFFNCDSFKFFTETKQ